VTSSSQHQERRAGGRYRKFGIIAMGIMLVCSVMIPTLPAPLWAQDYTVDRAASDDLTTYLRKNRLPLVGAQVLTSPDGQKRLVLYGFVASDFGKHDAETKALAHLGGSGFTVENRIAVRPEIEHLKSSHHNASSGSPAQAEAPSPGNLSFDHVMDDIQRYGVKDPPGEADLSGP
jgi:hypothetical protein